MVHRLEIDSNSSYEMQIILGKSTETFLWFNKDASIAPLYPYRELLFLAGIPGFNTFST